MKFTSIYSTVPFKAAARAITNKYNTATSALQSTKLLTPEAQKQLEEGFKKEMKSLAVDPEGYLEKLKAQKEAKPAGDKKENPKRSSGKGNKAKGGGKGKGDKGETSNGVPGELQ